MEYILIALLVINIVLTVILFIGKNKKQDFSEIRNEIGNNIKNMSDMINQTQKQALEMQDVRLKELNEKFVNFTKETNDKLKSFEERLNVSASSTEKKMAKIIRTTPMICKNEKDSPKNKGPATVGISIPYIQKSELKAIEPIAILFIKNICIK